MTFKRYILCAALLIGALALSAAEKPKTVYIFGFAASFNDSTVYFTDVQQLDSAYIDSKTKFLYGRTDYSYQLRDYLAEHEFPNATCVTSFALTRKEAEKKYLALRKRYTQHGDRSVKYLTTADFRFTPVKPEEVGGTPEAQ